MKYYNLDNFLRSQYSQHKEVRHSWSSYRMYSILDYVINNDAQYSIYVNQWQFLGKIKSWATLYRHFKSLSIGFYHPFREGLFQKSQGLKIREAAILDRQHSSNFRTNCRLIGDPIILEGNFTPSNLKWFNKNLKNIYFLIQVKAIWQGKFTPEQAHAYLRTLHPHWTPGEDLNLNFELDIYLNEILDYASSNKKLNKQAPWLKDSSISHCFNEDLMCFLEVTAHLRIGVVLYINILLCCKYLTKCYNYLSEKEERMKYFKPYVDNLKKRLYNYSEQIEVLSHRRIGDQALHFLKNQDVLIIEMQKSLKDYYQDLSELIKKAKISAANLSLTDYCLDYLDLDPQKVPNSYKVYKETVRKAYKTALLRDHPDKKTATTKWLVEENVENSNVNLLIAAYNYLSNDTGLTNQEVRNLHKAHKERPRNTTDKKLETIKSILDGDLIENINAHNPLIGKREKLYQRSIQWQQLIAEHRDLANKKNALLEWWIWIQNYSQEDFNYSLLLKDYLTKRQALLIQDKKLLAKLKKEIEINLTIEGSQKYYTKLYEKINQITTIYNYDALLPTAKMSYPLKERLGYVHTLLETYRKKRVRWQGWLFSPIGDRIQDYIKKKNLNHRNIDEVVNSYDTHWWYRWWGKKARQEITWYIKLKTHLTELENQYGTQEIATLESTLEIWQQLIQTFYRSKAPSKATADLIETLIWRFPYKENVYYESFIQQAQMLSTSITTELVKIPTGSSSKSTETNLEEEFNFVNDFSKTPTNTFFKPMEHKHCSHYFHSDNQFHNNFNLK